MKIFERILLLVVAFLIVFLTVQSVLSIDKNAYCGGWSNLTPSDCDELWNRHTSISYNITNNFTTVTIINNTVNDTYSRQQVDSFVNESKAYFKSTIDYTNLNNSYSLEKLRLVNEIEIAKLSAKTGLTKDEVKALLSELRLTSEELDKKYLGNNSGFITSLEAIDMISSALLSLKEEVTEPRKENDTGVTGFIQNNSLIFIVLVVALAFIAPRILKAVRPPKQREASQYVPSAVESSLDFKPKF